MAPRSGKRQEVQAVGFQTMPSYKLSACCCPWHLEEGLPAPREPSDLALTCCSPPQPLAPQISLQAAAVNAHTPGSTHTGAQPRGPERGLRENMASNPVLGQQ